MKEEESSPVENHLDTSIDDFLGPRTNEDKESDISDESSQRTTSPTDSNSAPVESPEPEATSANIDVAKAETETETETVNKTKDDKVESEAASSPMESNETVEKQTNGLGNIEVVTTVTIECSGNGEACGESGSKMDKEDAVTEAGEDIDSSKPEGEREKAENGETVVSGEGETKSDESAPGSEQVKESEDGELGSSFSEVLITQEEQSNSFSVNVTNIDTDDYRSSEDDENQPPPFVESSETVSDTPQTQEDVTSPEDVPKENGECPAITVDPAAGEGEGKGKEMKEKRSSSDSSSSSTEGEKLIPPSDQRRCKSLCMHMLVTLYI